MRWTWLRRACAVGALLLILWRIIDGSLIYSEALTERNALTGHTVPVIVHGRELFITPAQSTRLSPLHWTNGILIIMLIGFVVAKDKD
jgi:hypothetical protein